ncbi:nitroreductase/quinone reductase family protein [Geodermatophilus sp. SYSU D00758]
MTGGHVLTNRVANPVLRRVLRSRLGPRPGRRLAVVRYTGRRTGTAHELVARYVRDGGSVWILVGAPGAKTWWRNLREPADVELRLAGRSYRARAEAVVGAQRPQECAAGLATYLTAVPAAGRAVGLPGRTGSRRDAPRDVVREVVMVRADLT